MAVAGNEGFKLTSVYILVAFLLAKTLNRDGFDQTPKEIKKESIILKLRKSFYGLDDTIIKL